MGGATVGAHPLATWGADPQPGVSANAGFAGQGWNSTSVAPSAKYTSAEVEATDANRLVVGRWVQPGSGPDAPREQVQVLDAKSGKVLASPRCGPLPTMPAMSSSPGRQHFVDGPLRVKANGSAICVGGSERRKRVDLTAVTDLGRAFGTVGANLADVAPDGKVSGVALPAGAGAPIGVMTGNIAVHWNAGKAILTGNPIR